MERKHSMRLAKSDKKCREVYKPGSVLAMLSPRAIIHLGHQLLGGSSDLPGCSHHESDTAPKD